MLIGETHTGENIMLSFTLGGRHFTLSTHISPMACEDKAKSVKAEPILIHENTLHLDERCKELEVRYLNPSSGRTHIWRGATISYIPEDDLYEIHCENDSTPENRRRAVRIPINERTECVISLLNGSYPCIVNDVSVTGVGLDMDARLMDSFLKNRIICTKFRDEAMGCEFCLTAKCLHATKINERIVRCGCELINVTPSMNEYINTKQTHRLKKTDQFMKGDRISMQEQMIKDTVLPEKSDEGFMIAEDGLCPLCEHGLLIYDEGCYICPECGSMLEP